MKQLNTLPIEGLIEKCNIAIKSGQRTVVLDIREAQALYDSLSLVMTRLAGTPVVVQNSAPQENISIKVDGGGFR